MSDYTPRDKAIEAMDGRIHIAGRDDAENVLEYLNMVRDKLDAIPAADVVEVVRCKDCKHYDPYDQTERFYCYDGIEGCLPNDFCSYGERREE